MKIVDERKENKKVSFRDLKVGDVFEWDNFTYMKVFATLSSVNAVILNDGRTTRFVNPDTGVFPLNAELVIRGDKNE